MAYQGIKSLSLSQQYAALRTDWPEGEARLDKNGLSWVGPLLPSPLSRQYVARLTYRSLNHAPQIHILNPVLHELAQGRHIPHLYCQRTGQLCLFTPWLGQWKNHHRLSRTMLLWAELWLEYFEDWLSTNEWKGGGNHPDTISSYSFSTVIRRQLS